MKRKWPAQKRISPSRSKPDFPLAILSSQVVPVHFARFNEVTHDFATRDATPRLEWWNNFESVSAIASLIGRRTTKTPSRPSRPSVEKWSAIDYHTLGLVWFVRFGSRIAMRKRNGRTVSYVTTGRERRLHLQQGRMNIYEGFWGNRSEHLPFQHESKGIVMLS